MVIAFEPFAGLNIESIYAKLNKTILKLSYLKTKILFKL